MPGFEPPQGELSLQFEERWTGGYISENEWQSIGTRQSRDLELTTAVHTYDRPGRYTVAVKVIDISAIIRELAAGRAFTCPTSPQATTWASSLPCVIENLLHAAGLEASRLAERRTFTLPTLRFSMAELVEAIAEVHGRAAQELVRYVPYERIEALFGRFPPLQTPAADIAGFRHDATLTRLVQRALEG